MNIELTFENCYQWRDTHVAISDVRSQAQCFRAPQNGGMDSGLLHLTLEVARKAIVLFDLANMAGDPRYKFSNVKILRGKICITDS